MGVRVPLGFTRLKVVQFCVPLFFTNRASVDQALAESDLLGVILNLFFLYEWNNFLHQLVESLVASLFDGNASALRRAAISKFHLPARLASAARASEARFSAGGLRAGNHQFLLLVSEHLVSTAAQDGELASALAGEEGWSEFAEGLLREASSLADIAAPLDSDSDRDDSETGAAASAAGESQMHDEIAAAAAAADARFRFGGWQNASDSDSSEGDDERVRFVFVFGFFVVFFTFLFLSFLA